MEFQAIKKETRILSPADSTNKSIPSEIRLDPLTGRSARICHFMELKWEKPDFEAMIKGTEKTCPFCSGRVLEITPRFPEEIIPEGRLTKNDMVLFPNIAPYDSLGAVAVMGDRHFIPMTEITPGKIKNGFLLSMEFFKRVDELKHPEAVYHIINWNFMPPAGSSLIHPHLQVFSTSSAPNLMRYEMDSAKKYLEENGTNYWDDLIRIETEDKLRFLGRIGRSSWLTNYAPMGVAGDVLAVVNGVCSTLELSDKDLSDIADGLTRVMTGYDKMGIYSFNMNFFTGAKDDEHARFHLLFSPRTFFNQALGATDVGALRNLFNETICMAFPEDINKMLKDDF